MLPPGISDSGRPAAPGVAAGLARTVAQRLGGRLATAANAVLSRAERAADQPPDSRTAAAGGPRIVCFSPYAMWELHATWELTVLRALARRGCETRLIFCDAVSPTCDLDWERQSRPWDRCLVCQHRTTQAARLFRHPFAWLSRYVDAADRREAVDWAAALPAAGLRDAHFRGADLGAWCLGSVHSHLRLSRLDLGDPRVSSVYRGYLTGAAVTLAACRGLFAAERPDVLWLFNGRMSLTRVAFEVARSQGIRVICHERGAVRNSLRLWENERCSEYHGLLAAARRNAARPLTTGQLRAATAWVSDRRTGKNLNWLSFVKPRRDARETLARAGLSPHEPFLLALTSSDDEFVAEGDRNRVFREQHEWIACLLDWAGRDPRRRVVVRFHPNTSGTSWRYLADRTPRACVAADMAGLARPAANVLVIPPASPLDTYAFLDACSAVTTYGTTAGIEAAALGTTVIVADECRYHGMPWCRSAESPAHFEELLDGVGCAAKPPADVEIATGGLRFIWDYVLAPSITSRLIRQPGLHYNRPAYRTDVPSDLEYGRDPGIDRITDVVLGARPIYDVRPTADDATAGAERAGVIAHLRRFRAV